ncbi:MAG: hypothetical protein ACJ0FW_04020 [Gammaproteobacteria bacterium]
MAVILFMVNMEVMGDLVLSVLFITVLMLKTSGVMTSMNITSLSDKEKLYLSSFMNCLNKGFNSDEKFTLKSLKEMCNKLNIKYVTDSWV